MQLGSWHCIGPFKDALFGLFSRSFHQPAGPEEDVVAQGVEFADLGTVYHSVALPGDEETARRWQEQKSWQDGYWCALPEGPPPSRNEVVYAYRTITAKKDVTVDADLFVMDAARVWLNGNQIGQVYGHAGYQRPVCHGTMRLPLKAGPNRLLVKVVAYLNDRGFAFSIPGLHPTHPFRTNDAGGPLPGALKSAESRFDLDYEPYASAGRSAAPSPQSVPAELQNGKRDTWHETLIALHQASRVKSGSHFEPFRSEVMRPDTPARHVRVNVAGVARLWLVCTDAGDGKGWDAPVWGNPKLIAKDGREVSLTKLEPVSSKVGLWETVRVNKNWLGNPLRIGKRTFARGFWAHAPSEIEFALDGKYEWLETWIGIDSTSKPIGSVQFNILNARDNQAERRLLWRLVERDFPDADSRHEMRVERADAIWEGFLDSGETNSLFDGYAKAIVGMLALPADGADLLPARQEPNALELVRTVYHRVRRYKAALRRLGEFHFDVDPTPSYDPPKLKMCEVLDRQLPPTPRAKAYVDRLAAIKTQAAAALTDLETGTPGAADAVIRAADALDRLWTEQIRSLGPIVFVRRDRCSTNVVSPYHSTAPAPSSICVFDPRKPDEPPRVIYHDDGGSVYDMNLSYDAKTILFAAQRQGVAGGWHIHEVGVDGKGLKQITAGDGNDTSPLLLPDGQIMFVSDRAKSFLVCQPPIAAHLYVCNRDGSHVRRVSGNTLSDHTPQILNDGRVLFTRWDYGVNVNVFTRQALWSMNPDATRLQLFFGNTIEDPAGFYEARQVPGRPEVICTFGPHHHYQAGSLGMVYNGLGLEAPRGEGLRWVSRELPITMDMAFPHGYQDPYPLNERQFLVSYGGDGEHRNRIYLMDDRGNKQCVYEDDRMGCWCPMPLKPRKRPPILPSASDNREYVHRPPLETNRKPDDLWATLVVADVYAGLPGHVKPGEIKYIQIMEQVPKTHSKLAPEAWGDSPTIGRGTYYVRRLIGTVPVEADGSAHFLAPAIRDISLNALDARGRAVQMMKTTFHVMPGERTGCVGCHEHPRSTPLAKTPLAARRAPDRPVPPSDWGTNGIIDYPKVVQPVWDQYCVTCHSGPRPDGNFDLSGDKTRYYSMSYNMLLDRGLVYHATLGGEAPTHTTPKAFGSMVSGIRKYIEAEHGDVLLPLAARKRIYAWIDADVPYYGTYAHTSENPALTGFRDRWYVGVESDWFQKQFLPTFNKRCAGCHQRTVDCSQPCWPGPIHAKVTSKLWPDWVYMSYHFGVRDPMASFAGPAHRINLTHPEFSQMLTAPLAEKAGGLDICKDNNGKPVFADTNDPDYQTMLEALRYGAEILQANPRVDMLPAKEVAGRGK